MECDVLAQSQMYGGSLEEETMALEWSCGVSMSLSLPYCQNLVVRCSERIDFIWAFGDLVVVMCELAGPEIAQEPR